MPSSIRVVWPADYYASETPKPVLPRWAAFGCGAASVFVLLIVFAGGAWLRSGGLVDFMDLVFGMSMGELRGMYTSEVTPAQKEALEREMEAMREQLRTRGIPVANVQPVLQTMQKAIKDEKLTPAEVDAITAAAKKAQTRKVSK
jgi:hypothetical protein